MATLPFPTFAEAIWSPQDRVPSLTPARDPYIRALDAVYELESGESGPQDVVALIRQVLRIESLRQGRDQRLRVPLNDRWPDISQWKSANHHIAEVSGHSLVIEAVAWNPSWASSPPAFRSFEGLNQRTLEEVPGDMILDEAFGYDKYTCAGQRDGFRAVLTSRPGATILVPLPTGGGKTTVALAPGLVQPPGRTTVVVVPTISLALDLERRAIEILERLGTPPTTRLAYYGGLATDERDAIRTAIRDGSQRFVFTSPESALTSLRPALLHAAASGALSHLVVDEAHIVAQWGDSFRPAYQHLTGLRNSIMDQQQSNSQPLLTTVLLTATVTTYTFEVLRAMFSKPFELSIVGQLVLRTEHEYWLHRTEEPGQSKQILDAVNNLPRPLIIYTTLRRDADRLYREIHRLGYRRVSLFTGATSPGDRESVIRDWSDGRIDMVVGTSAFGLGVDVPDVRAVLHATVPENLDRLYQEVGRSGRDGRSATSVVLWTKDDLRTAESLALQKLATAELARRRWQTMMQAGTPSSATSGAYQLPLSTVPNEVERDSDYNRLWNARTLQLMARAGMIEIVGEPPPDTTTPSNEDDFEAAWSDWFESVTVRPLRGDLSAGRPWAEEFEQARTDIKEAGKRGFQRLRQVLAGTQCIGESLQETYTLSTGDTWFRPAAACGGCDHCRQADVSPYSSVAPPIAYRSRPADPRIAVVQNLFAITPPWIVPYSDDSINELNDALGRLAQHGFSHFFLPYGQEPAVKTPSGRPHNPVFVDPIDLWSEDRPILWSGGVLVVPMSWRRLSASALVPGTMPTVVFVPDSIEDPDHPDRKLTDMRMTFPLSTLRAI